MDNFGAKFVVFLSLCITKRKMMRHLRLIPALLLAVMMVSCNTTQKLYEAQEYDQVIQRLAPSAKKGQINDRDMNILAASYHKANQNDHNRIQTLKATGQPDVWPEVYQRYCSMKGRNEMFAKLPKKTRKGMNYERLNFDEDMLAARNKAEIFLVAKANQLLSTGSKSDAESASQYIEQLSRTNRENPRLKDLRKRQVLYSADEVTLNFTDEKPMPKAVVDVILDFDDKEIPFDIVRTKKSTALVSIDVQDVTVSPIRLDEVSFKEYNGGKAVEVTDHSQNKTATISGVMEYRDRAGRLIGSVPFKATSTFKNDYTTIKGDREGCSAETLNRLNSKPVPVPTDESLLLDAAKKLNDLIAAELKK